MGCTRMSSTTTTRFSEQTTASLNGLVGRTGVVGGTLKLPGADGDGRMSIYAASTGNLAAVLDGVRVSTRGASTWGTIDGAGGAFDSEDARLLSIAEGVERYSSCVYDEEQFVWATARELGAEAVDLTQFPSVSEAETKRTPAWVAPNVDAPMRWVRSVCMMTGAIRWIPAIAVYLHLPFASIGERFTIPISTGCALHTDPQLAIRNALLEVIERDAVALTWLQQIRWPRLNTTLLSDSEEVAMAMQPTSTETMQYFNATTDLGSPPYTGSRWFQTIQRCDRSWLQSPHGILTPLSSNWFVRASRAASPSNTDSWSARIRPSSSQCTMERCTWHRQSAARLSISCWTIHLGLEAWRNLLKLLGQMPTERKQSAGC